MKLWVYLNSAFLLRAAIGFSRRLTLAGEASYSFSLYSIICCISCTYFHLMLVSGSFRKKPPHPRFFYYPVSSKNEGNLEGSVHKKQDQFLVIFLRQGLQKNLEAFGIGCRQDQEDTSSVLGADRTI